MKTLLFKSIFLAFSVFFISTPSFAAKWLDEQGYFVIGKNENLKGDYPALLNKLKPLADKNDAQAQFELAMAYKYNLGGTDHKKAFSLLKKAIAKNIAPAFAELAQYYDINDYVKYNETGKQDFSKARQLCEKGTKSGSGKAMICLSELYYDGKGVKKNKAKAKELLEKAKTAPNTDKNFIRLIEIGRGQF